MLDRIWKNTRQYYTSGKFDRLFGFVAQQLEECDSIDE